MTVEAVVLLTFWQRSSWDGRDEYLCAFILAAPTATAPVMTSRKENEAESAVIDGRAECSASQAIEDSGYGEQLLAVGNDSSKWRWVMPAVSLAILVIGVWQLRLIDFNRLQALIPSSPIFWILFAISYFGPIGIDYLIFRRLWHVPAEAFVALLRKLVLNELLLDYVGEAYFFGWARKRLKLTMSPFGAIKDVAILSALSANGVTLVLLALAYPFLPLLKIGATVGTILASTGLLVVVSIAVLVFGKRVFSLPRHELWFVAALQTSRIILATSLSAVLWGMVLPGAPFGWWVLLAAARMLLSRLPLLTNKDVLLAGLAVAVIGHDTDISALLALMASIGLLAHLIVGAALASGSLLEFGRSRRR